MAISEVKKKIVIDNYFKTECDINTSIKEAFTKGFELGLKKAFTPQPKSGRWIEGKYRDDDIRYNDSSYKCNKCGRIVDFKENYCPDCGEKMEQESK